MEQLVNKFANKLVQARLGQSSGPGQPLVGGLDDTLVWNRKADETVVLEEVFKGLSINSLVFLRPAEPYGSLITFLARNALNANGLIQPKDCETRTFLHDLPVISEFCADKIIAVLKKRKCVIIAPGKINDPAQGPAIIAHGTVSPEQGFVTISSVCFASFIKFFTDYLEALEKGLAPFAAHHLFDAIWPYATPIKKALPKFTPYPFSNEETVYSAIIEAGLKTVEYGLVDSFFGNVSYCWNHTLYISQTGSSLDELSGCIDPVPLDSSTSAGLTASSELSAHLETISCTGSKAILHGHPKFCVILSMACDPVEKAACHFKEHCHTQCPKKRFIGLTPIVPGEVGTGPTGLCNTLPPALSQSNSAIVYGHGLFTTGKNNFLDAFQTMVEVEDLCRKRYIDKVSELRKNL
ncbi:MAG: class II aldolase/adducin family protein [Proteobacteria bacterium]|nr:class II aldolase/adducin family protein [Pseudomonadota bacterium]MBU1583734.1 class II aldolase/adducin family protein [Pseudomonadota bacterium]MBU2451780.1 class II aldolase/adducin family protein [Pseudomonadota bacterium]MBU2631128.1 class II aldolase/adducin family protein [Pseudomonadota bacterium]